MDREELFKSFEDYRRQIREGLLKSHEHYDKTLTLISSGGLVLSMAFVEKLGGANPIHSSCLVASWIFLGLTLLLSLTSSLLSIRNFNKVEKSFDNVIGRFKAIDWDETDKIDTLPLPEATSQASKFASDSEMAHDLYQEHIDMVERINRGMDFTTYGPFFTLLVGVGFLIFFASTNILNSTQNGKRKTNTETTGSQTERTKTGHQRNSTPDPTKDTTQVATSKPEEVKTQYPP